LIVKVKPSPDLLEKSLQIALEAFLFAMLSKNQAADYP